jgi:hypothetical protein
MSIDQGESLQMHQYRIRLTPSLVESMTLSTMEAYCIRQPKARRYGGVETYGYVWGTKKRTDDVTIFHLTKLAVSITAERSYMSVFPNPMTGALKNKVLKRMAPHLTLLGDFHSHPWANQKSMKRDVGYNFSPQDFVSFLEEDLFWEMSDNNPVMLVQTVVRLSRKGRKGSGWQRLNVFHFDIDDHRFWINAVVGYLDIDGNRRHTGNRTRSVIIEPLALTTNADFRISG